MTDDESLTPIALCVDRLLGRYVGAFRVTRGGIGTDEVLHCETPVRNTRMDAKADALAFWNELNAG